MKPHEPYYSHESTAEEASGGTTPPTIPLVSTAFLNQGNQPNGAGGQTVVVFGQTETVFQRSNSSSQSEIETDEQPEISALPWWRVGKQKVLLIHVILTMLLLSLKILVAYLSSSMSIRSLVGDSAVDLINLVVLSAASFFSKRVKRSYPFGRTNLVTLASFTMALFMTSMQTVVMYQAAVRLNDKAQYFWYSGQDPEKANITASNAAIVGALILIKLILLAVCIINPSPQSKMLKKDHLVDIPMNAFALFLGYIGSFGTRGRWTEKLIMIDDIGAICLGIYGTFMWLPEILKHAQRVCNKIVEDPVVKERIRSTAEEKLNEIVRGNEFVRLDCTTVCHGGGDNIIITQTIILPDAMAHGRVKEIFAYLKEALEQINHVERVVVFWEQ